MNQEQQAALLEIVSTDDLYNALFARFDHAIFSGIIARPTKESPGQVITSRRHKGDNYICQGLANGVMSTCNAQIDEMTETIDNDEL